MSDINPPHIPVDALSDEAECNRIEATWEDEMGDLSPKRRYKQVAVMLLYWDKVGNSYLDSAEEVAELRSCFENTYGFKVYQKSLNPLSQSLKRDKEGKAQQFLQKYLSDFVLEEDNEDSLLIIYYAGHGNPDTNGNLLLTGGNQQKQPGGAHVDKIVWRRAESLLCSAHYADVLVIMDCCFAGRLNSYRPRPATFDKQIFEVLGATGSDGLTRVPGPTSFTKALITALASLANEEDGFTTNKLLGTIQEAPNFPREDQEPFIAERTGHSIKRLMIQPLKDTAKITRLSAATQEERDAFEYSLSIQFLFAARPTCEETKVLSQALKDLIRAGELKANHIIYRGLHRKGRSIFELPSAVYTAISHFKDLIKKPRCAELNKVSLPVESIGIPTPPSESVVDADELDCVVNQQLPILLPRPIDAAVNLRVPKPSSQAHPAGSKLGAETEHSIIQTKLIRRLLSRQRLILVAIACGLIAEVVIRWNKFSSTGVLGVGR